jgi:nitrous oxide reductase accessory protein NosL
MNADKRASDVHYDRCSPSILAFAQRSDAAQFAREHGGEVLRFSELVSAFSR